MKTRQFTASHGCDAFLFTSILLAISCALIAPSWAQRATERPKRAAPPKFDKAGGGSDTFFSDAFQEGLRGVRPDNFGKPVKATGSVAGVSNGASQEIATVGWSRLISPETIEDTIKSTRFELDKSINQPAAFAGGGNRQARASFVTLTTLFAIIAEYDGDVRWKADAVAARDRCRNAAQVCKVGSVQAYNAAKATKEEIADLIGGNSIGEVERTPNKWDQLADRSSLMKQFEVLVDGRIQPAVANDASFKSQMDEILVAAELSAAIAEILMKEDMEDAGDDDYDAYCKQIQTAVTDIVDAIKQNNGAAARSAAGVISKACSECHETYKG